MTKGSGKKLDCVMSLVVILAAAGATAIPSFGEEILLHTQQPCNISDNRTLVAEDVDPSAGVVWLKLYSRNETLKSSLLGVGGHFDYGHTNLTVNKIYAGGEWDLVELRLNGSSSGNSSANASADVSGNLSGSSKASTKSPAFAASVFFMIVLALGFQKRSIN